MAERKLTKDDIKFEDIGFGLIHCSGWMVKMDQIFESQSVGRFNHYQELYDWQSSASRHITGDASNMVYTSSSLQHSLLVLLMPVGDFIPTLENYMNQGHIISETIVVKLGKVNGIEERIEEITYRGCRIIKVLQKPDSIVVHLGIADKEHITYKFSKDGTKQGRRVSKYDYGSQNN